MFLLQKSIEISKLLISSWPRQFELSPKRFATRILPQNVRFNISKYLLQYKPQVAFATISNWFLFILK